MDRSTNGSGNFPLPNCHPWLVVLFHSCVATNHLAKESWEHNEEKIFQHPMSENGANNHQFGQNQCHTPSYHEVVSERTEWCCDAALQGLNNCAAQVLVGNPLILLRFLRQHHMQGSAMLFLAPTSCPVLQSNQSNMFVNGIKHCQFPSLKLHEQIWSPAT